LDLVIYILEDGGRKQIKRPCELIYGVACDEPSQRRKGLWKGGNSLGKASRDDRGAGGSWGHQPLPELKMEVREKGGGHKAAGGEETENDTCP